MKKFALNVSQNFLAYHPKKGQPTFFVEQILDGRKKHTVRSNYHYWNRIAEKVNKGEGLLVVTVWKGRPYHTKKIDITTFNYVGIQKFSMKMRKRDKSFAIAYVDGRMLLPDEFTTFCANDGLSVFDFVHWMKRKDTEGVVIHFGHFKY
jgi:hypothetical protein